MKPALSFFSALFFIPLALYAGGVTGGNPEYKASATWLLLKKSPQGKVLFNGEWYSEYLLAKMMAPCGGTVGGTGMTDDFDGDGVCNNADIDDDNDGVVDATESPACFYTSAEMATAATVTTPLAIGSGDNVNTLKDGTLTGSFNFTAQALANATILEFTSPTAAVYSSIGIQMNATTTSASNGFGATGATAKVQGFDGTAWVDISAATDIAGTTSGRITIPITNTTTAFSSYRIVGVGTANSNTNPIGELVLTAPTPFIASKYPKSSCSVNTDGDGNVNHQDLDSDGDGCSDAFESGATTNMAANFAFTSTDTNQDGLVDAVDGNNDGVVDYTSTYSTYATGSNFAACRDTDGDGVTDIDDIDDDNDGIVDALESPFCFYTENESKNLNNSTVTSDFAWLSTQPLANAYDGDASTIAWVNPGVTNIAGLGLIDFTLPVQKASLISNVQLEVGATGLSSSAAALWRLEGWDGAAWVALSGTQAMNTANTTYTFSNTLQPGTKFSRYRIAGTTTGAGVPVNGRLAEIHINYSNYVPSANPKLTCANDFDGDAVVGHHDLDSDNDGCPDLKEAGVSPLGDIYTPSSVTNNSGTSYGIAAGDLEDSQLNPGPAFADTNNDGLNDSVDSDHNGMTNYTSVYDKFALNSSLNACVDSDADQIADVVDIDDDNDGVLDVVETQCSATPSWKVTVYDYSTSGFGDCTDANSLGSLVQYASGTMTYDNGLSLNWTNPSTQGSAVSSLNASGGNVTGTNPPNITYAVFFEHTFNYLDAGLYTLSPGTIYDGKKIYKVLANGTDSLIYCNNSWTTNTPLFHVYFAPGTKLKIIAYENGETNTQVVMNVNLANGSPYPCNNIVDLDTDNDGIPNRLDLDSDGDGCPDTKEAILFNNSSVTTTPGDVKNGSGGMVTSTTTTDNATVPGPYGSNGFADALQSASNPDAYKYVYTYQFLATLAANNACTDNDGDGVADFALDLDSDDDGIPEAVESPSCFYTEEQAMDITEGVTSDFTWSDTQPLSNTYDDNTTSYGQVTPAINILNQSLVTFELPIIDRATIDNVKLTTSSVAFGTGTWRLEGLNVATNTWEPLSASQAMNATGTTYTFTNTLQPNMAYHSYRIVGTSSTNVTNNARLAEFDIQYKNYNPSLHRVKTGCNSDTDNDGVPNFFDRDSDGDGCPDAVEAGVSGTLIPGDIFNAGTNIPADRAVAAGPYGSNGLADGVETSPESAVLNYTSTYNLYAIDPTVNVCTDTDGDGKNDLTDIDDDNDGILDAVESPSCFFSATEANAISKITSQFTSPDDDQSDGNIQLLHDGSTALTFNFNAVAAGSNPTGSNLFAIEYPFAVSLATLVVSDNISTTTNANAVVVGSNDGITWSAALSPSTVITTTPVSFAISTSQPYKYYRIQTGSVPGALATANTIGEITSTLATGYVASAHPKPTCTADADGDGIVNHHDLDSDGDGCADGMEGGTNDASDAITSSDLVHSSLPGGNTGSAYTGTAGPVNYNLGNDEDANGVPTIVSGGQVLGSAQNAALQPVNCIPVAPPVASADTLVNNTPGAPASINVVTNDTDGDPAVPSTVSLSGTGTCEDTDNDGDCDKLTVPGEGIWTVTPAGVVTFTPDSSFTSDPTPISYTVKDSDGETSSPAQIVIDNVPVASNDMGVGAYGASVTVTVVANDTTGDAVIPATLQIVGTASPGDSLMVPGEGKWTVNTTTGAITFTPESGFRDDPTPINYTVQDASGNVSNSAQLLLDYSPMPVTLVSFSAGKTPEGVLLKWRTTDETNFDRFEIEQSAKPQNGFKKIGTVKGGGSDYRFLDLENHNGASYYRLKMVDRAADGSDGTYEYSRIVTITDLNGQQMHRVYPNPSGVRSVSIASVTAIESYAIYDVSGREIPVKMTEQNGKYQFTFDKDARSGLYVISYRSAGRTFSQQFVLSF